MAVSYPLVQGQHLFRHQRRYFARVLLPLRKGETVAIFFLQRQEMQTDLDTRQEFGDVDILSLEASPPWAPALLGHRCLAFSTM